MSQQHLVAVVGAGPAGLYGTRKLAEAGHRVVLLNRDIKPGGLAEYGIYPTKEKMKGGLRKHFAKILSSPNVSYFGHLPVGEGYALHLGDLREFKQSMPILHLHRIVLSKVTRHSELEIRTIRKSIQNKLVQHFGFAAVGRAMLS